MLSCGLLQVFSCGNTQSSVEFGATNFLGAPYASKFIVCPLDCGDMIVRNMYGNKDC